MLIKAPKDMLPQDRAILRAAVKNKTSCQHVPLILKTQNSHCFALDYPLHFKTIKFTITLANWSVKNNSPLGY